MWHFDYFQKIKHWIYRLGQNVWVAQRWDGESDKIIKLHWWWIIFMLTKYEHVINITVQRWSSRKRWCLMITQKILCTHLDSIWRLECAICASKFYSNWLKLGRDVSPLSLLHIYDIVGLICFDSELAHCYDTRKLIIL